MAALLLALTVAMQVFTDARGVYPLLVLLAASAVSGRAGRGAAAALTGIAGVLYAVTVAAGGQTSDLGMALTAAGAVAWVVVAWGAATSAQQRCESTARLDSAMQELSHRAMHDPLTGLANRDLLLDRLDHGLHRAERHGGRVAVLYLDLDDFKRINDSLGHKVGDYLLLSFARRLSGLLRDSDTCARIGGDEFVLVCEDLHHDGEAVQIAERILSRMQPPFVIDNHVINAGASIGIAVPSPTLPVGEGAAEQLLQAADQAMYRAKQRGGGFEVYNEALRQQAVARLSTETQLRHAVEHDQLTLHYQPIIDLRDGRLAGVEALLRWKHPTRGLLPPIEFLPVAESSPVMIPLGEWVLRQACEQAAQWDQTRQHARQQPGHRAKNRADHQAKLTDAFTVAINVSLRQLMNDAFDDTLAEILRDTGADPAGIHLEITETVLAEATPAMKAQLTNAAEHGVQLGLDDFGTGYSSLTLLKEFPVRFLKIDRSFVAGLGTDRDDTAITEAVIGLSHTLDLDAVAEGIETPAQLEHLRRRGCRYGQGYHLGRPQPADDIDALIAADEPLFAGLEGQQVC